MAAPPRVSESQLAKSGDMLARSAEKAPYMALRRERIREIADMFVKGSWHRLKSPGDLADRWGLARDTVKGMAKEAVNLIRQWADEDADLIRTQLLGELETARKFALAQMATNKDSKYGAQWLSGFLQVIDRQATLTGIAAPTRTENTNIHVGLNDVTELRKAIEANKSGINGGHRDTWKLKAREQYDKMLAQQNPAQTIEVTFLPTLSETSEPSAGLSTSSPRDPEASKS